MPVTESVNHQNVDRAGHSGEVGPRRSEHVVGVHVEETGNEVDTVCRNQGDQNDTGTGGAEERLQEMSDALTHIEIQSTTHEGVGDQVERVNHSVSLNNREIDEGQSVKQTWTGEEKSVPSNMILINYMAYPLGRLPNARMNCSMRKKT